MSDILFESIHFQDSKSLASCLSNSETKIVVWHGGDWPTDDDANALSDWTTNGGGFVYGMYYENWEDNGQSDDISFFTTYILM